MKSRVYFDNAATTPLLPEVIDTMTDVLRNNFGNPSSIHHFGRLAKTTVESARRLIANHLSVSPAEILFTSGGTEANNHVLGAAINDLGVQQVITSPIEHHSVLFPLKNFQAKGLIELKLVKVDYQGHIDFSDLEKLLSESPKALVSLMHANNEIGNLLSIKEVSKLCRKYNAFFHSDMVQTIGHYRIDLKAIDVDFVTSSAHKYHGPKGVGFLYFNNNRTDIKPMLYGGAQERNLRAGTENVAAIAGMSKALQIAINQLDEQQKAISELKAYMIEQFTENLSGIDFLGDSRDKGLYTVLNVLFPESDFGEMLVMNLDIEGIAASSGSACSSGTNEKSHVLEAIGVPENRTAIRFSFNKLNTNNEVGYCVQVLKKYFPHK